MSLNDGYLTGDAEVNLRDYKHASKIFRDANFRLAPKHGFSFHVAFDFATGIGFGEQDSADRIQAGLLVKSVDLPSFTIDNKINNAYNRKNVIQSKIAYSPVSITFHDDSANLTNSIWQSYYEYYYGDSYGEASSYGQNTKYNDMNRQNWGFIPPSKAYFNSIRIYSLSQNKYTGYTLVNPLITSWRHGSHDVSDDNLMENKMELTYETLLYTHGIVGDDDDEEPKYFTDMGYDTTESPLGLGIGEGPPKSVVASGGSIRASHGIFDAFADSDFAGGLIDVALTGDKTGLKDAITGQATEIGKGILRGDDVNSQYNFPSPVRNIIGGIQNNPASQISRAVNVTKGNQAPSQIDIQSNNARSNNQNITGTGG